MFNRPSTSPGPPSSHSRERETMSVKTIAFFREGDLMILLNSPSKPTQPEWDAYVRAVDATIEGATPTSRLRGVLVVSAGGGPDAMQRAQLVKAANPSPVPVAICSSSAVVRGIVTALTWIYRAKTVSFGFDDVEGAFRHLAIDEIHWPALRERIRAAQRELGWRAIIKRG